MTGDMWNSFNVIAVQEGLNINAEFGFLDTKQKEIYEFNNKREPSEIVDFSEQEMSDFEDELITKLSELI
jgi:predicted Zn-dependent peptidase